MYDFSILRDLRKREGFRIDEISARSGISSAVISKMERNVSQPSLDTLDRISRVFRMNPSDVLALAESRTARRLEEHEHTTDGFHFREISGGDARCLLGKAEKGARLSRPEVHGDEYEMCWVLRGRLLFSLPEERHEIGAGNGIQFDAVLEHVYEALEPVTFILTHIPKHT